MNKILGSLAIVLLLAFGAAYFGSPVLAFHQLREAAETGDKDRLDALVDFPAVRENLKTQIDNKVTKLARKSGGLSFLPLQVFSKLGAEVGNRAVDRLVTPEAISDIVAYGERPRDVDAGDGDGAASPKTKAKVVTNFAYLTPDRVRVAVAPASHPGTPIALIMDRQGLFSWRVKAIELPGAAKDAVDAKDLY